MAIGTITDPFLSVEDAIEALRRVASISRVFVDKFVFDHFDWIDYIQYAEGISGDFEVGGEAYLLLIDKRQIGEQRFALEWVHASAHQLDQMREMAWKFRLTMRKEFENGY